jgi:hypothetical protein
MRMLSRCSEHPLNVPIERPQHADARHHGRAVVLRRAICSVLTMFVSNASFMISQQHVYRAALGRGAVPCLESGDDHLPDHASKEF